MQEFIALVLGLGGTSVVVRGILILEDRGTAA